MNDSHLLPELSLYADRFRLNPRDVAVARALTYFDAGKSQAIASGICCSSMEIEWAIHVSRATSDDYATHVIQIDEDVVDLARSHEKWPVKSSFRNLDAHVARLIHSVWVTVLKDVRYGTSPQKEGRSFHFSGVHETAGILCGRTTAPDLNTAPGEMVALMAAIFNYTMLLPRDPESDLAEIRRRISWFENAGLLR